MSNTNDKNESGLVRFAKTRIRISNPLITSALAEVLGTTIVSLFVHGARCQTYLMVPKPSNINILLGGPIGVLLATIICSPISGGHVNPAVTLGVAIAGEIGWKKAAVYWISQLVGAYLGFVIVYALYSSKFRNQFVEGNWAYPNHVSDQHSDSCTNCPQFSSTFAPIPDVFAGRSFPNQIIGSAILVIVLLVVLGANKRKTSTSRNIFALAHAISLVGISLAFQVGSNRELNPVMDLGSRFMALTVGYPLDAVLDISHDDEAFYNIRTLPNIAANLFGPFFGAAFGTFIFISVIAVNLPNAKSLNYESQVPKPLENNAHDHDSGIPESQTFVTVL